MDTSKATKRPWYTDRRRSCTAIVNGRGSDIIYLDDHHEYNGEPCGSVASQDKTQAEIDANAALIVAAVNSYEAMRDALERNADIIWKGIREIGVNDDGMVTVDHDWLMRIAASLRAALALAEGKP